MNCNFVLTFHSLWTGKNTASNTFTPLFRIFPKKTARLSKVNSFTKKKKRKHFPFSKVWLFRWSKTTTSVPVKTNTVLLHHTSRRDGANFPVLLFKTERAYNATAYISWPFSPRSFLELILYVVQDKVRNFSRVRPIHYFLIARSTSEHECEPGGGCPRIDGVSEREVRIVSGKKCFPAPLLPRSSTFPLSAENVDWEYALGGPIEAFARTDDSSAKGVQNKACRMASKRLERMTASKNIWSRV